MIQQPRQLPPRIALKIIRAIETVPDAVLIGGQATNFWAEGFSSEIDELAEFGPFTSKDVDFLGRRGAAEQVAAAINGTPLYPPLGDHTPSTAVVRGVVDGYPVEVDFLESALGVPLAEKRALPVDVTASIDGEEVQFTITVLHPIDCLISRVINIRHPSISRTDEIASRQLFAAHHILRHFISRLIEDNSSKEWHKCLNALEYFLLRDEYGVRCHEGGSLDHLDILRHFADDKRIDLRYRQNIIAKAIARIERKRRSVARRSTLASAGDAMQGTLL